MEEKAKTSKKFLPLIESGSTPKGLISKRLSAKPSLKKLKKSLGLGGRMFPGSTKNSDVDGIKIEKENEVPPTVIQSSSMEKRSEIMPLKNSTQQELNPENLWLRYLILSNAMHTSFLDTMQEIFRMQTILENEAFMSLVTNLLPEDNLAISQEKSKTYKVLITGGAGFIGSHLVDFFTTLGWDVTVLDNLHHSVVQKFDVAKLIIGDIRWQGRIDKFDLVIHCAAQTSVTKSETNPYEDVAVNVMGTVLQLQNYPEAKHVFLSSCAVYADGGTRNENSLTIPSSVYGISKLCAEQYVLRQQLNLVVRLGNVYGPRQEKRGEAAVMAHFASDEPIVIYGDGKSIRDYIHVYDVVEAIGKLLGYGGIVNIGTGKGTSTNDLAKGFKKIIKYEPAREGEMKHIVLDISRLIETTGFTPKPYG